MRQCPLIDFYDPVEIAAMYIDAGLLRYEIVAQKNCEEHEIVKDTLKVEWESHIGQVLIFYLHVLSELRYVEHMMLPVFLSQDGNPRLVGEQRKQD